MISRRARSLGRVLLPTLLAVVTAPWAASADPRPRETMDAARIRLAIEKLNVVGSVLYVAAHPDDENTAMLAWLASGRKVRTAYLSMTRGDGGQNLIGSDTGERLGVIRTQELLAARRIDGAEQFFTRAIDFGYSKNPDETLAIWGHDRILADVVWVIRRFRPDVIITRFPTDGAGGHGHHTASAILAEEAFEAAGDSTRFAEQLRQVRPWRARRLVWNVFRFGAQGPDTVRGRLSIDLGAYDPLLGRSYTEIAGESRSLHKSQGFGSAERRGSFTNTLEHRRGERAAADVFEGVNLTWSRFPGGEKLTTLLQQAAREFRPERPASLVPLLLRARTAMALLPDDPVVERKREDLDDVIRSCLGLWIEAVASTPLVTPGGRVRIVTSALNRSDVPVTLHRVEVLGSEAAREGDRLLPFNMPTSDTFSVTLPEDARPTQPYWLEERPLEGSFEVRDPLAVGAAENPPALRARFVVDLAAARIPYEVPVVHRWTDPVRGERYRDFGLVPPVTMRFEQAVYVFPDTGPRELRLVVQTADRPANGTLRLRLPDGWRCEPPEIAVALAAGEADTLLRFRVTPGSTPAAATVAAEFDLGNRTYGARRVTLDYAHIPMQTLLPPAEARLVRAEVKHSGSRIGYLMGSGDQVPEALEQIGFHVTLLSDEEVEHRNLSGFDAIVVGVRAYNTRPRLKAHQESLLDYVARGGRLVVQYSTAEEALNDRLGPLPFKISRDRVTVEAAPVRLLKPDHPLLNVPNRITATDFEGWVQERGLYFANPWDSKYETVLSCNDPAEPARDGGLLYVRHGRGVFIYTAYAWFRQLPAGVPGAYRLFANLVSADAPRGDSRPGRGVGR